MINTYVRYISFLFGCMGARLGLGLLMQSSFLYQNTTLYHIINIAIAIMGIGFIVIYLGGLRKTGIETGGKPIWWDYIRPLHGSIYLLASWFMFTKKKQNINTAGNLIMFDAIFGLVVWYLHHFTHLNNIYVKNIINHVI